MAKRKTPTPRTPASRKSLSRKSLSRKSTSRKSTSRKSTHSRSARKPRVVARSGRVTVSEVAELDELRRELERTASGGSPLRWNADPEEVQRSVAHLVLTLVEFIRKLLERQAIRRMEGGTLSHLQTEDVGRALMQLEATIHDIASRFGIRPDDLNMDVGPVGTLM